MAIRRKIAFASVGALFVIVVAPLVVLRLFRPGTTAPFLDAQGHVVSGSIAEMAEVRLSGLPQFVLMRALSETTGQSRNSKHSDRRRADAIVEA